MEKRKHELKSTNLILWPTNEEDPWNTDWIITLVKEGGMQIGTASFAGEKALGAVPLHMELYEPYRNQGYGTEATQMLVGWAFHFRNVYEVKAETEHENDKAVKALEKAGFVYRGGDRHIENYSIIKNKTTWTGLYVMIGIFLGVMLGVVLSSPKLGMGIGLVVSITIGASMDAGARKERELVTGKKDR